MPAVKTTVYECPNCRLLYQFEDEALECCNNGPQEGWECSECGELYGPEDKSSARECCEYE